MVKRKIYFGEFEIDANVDDVSNIMKDDSPFAIQLLREAVDSNNVKRKRKVR